jgi:nicotinamide-nucleotide amidase
VDDVDRVLQDAVTQLHEALGSIVFSVDGRNLEEVVAERLATRGLRIAVAESCTGGLVGARLTDVPGSSTWFVGGIVAYANAVKTGQLGVASSIIDAHGAVSEPVAEAMAAGVRARLGSDLGVAVTGIAGPDGGTAAKPVGTVVIAMAGPAPSVKTFRFVGDREMIRQQATLAAIDMVRRAIT